MIRRIDSMADFVTGISDFQRNWQRFRKDALIGALLNGGFVRDVIRRTPKSEYERYKNRRDGMRYGQQRLLRSMIHGGMEGGTKSDFALIHERIDAFEVAFGPDADWDVPYAIHQHESKVPDSKRSQKITIKKLNKDTGRMKNYTVWTDGWSVEHTGNKFLEKPWNENQIRTERQLIRNIDAQLKDKGLL